MREKVLQKEASTLWNEGWLPVPRHAAVQKWLLPCFGKKRRWRPLGYLPFFSQGYQKVQRGHLTGEACFWGQESMLSSLIHIYVLCRNVLLQLLFFKQPWGLRRLSSGPVLKAVKARPSLGVLLATWRAKSFLNFYCHVLFWLATKYGGIDSHLFPYFCQCPLILVSIVHALGNSQESLLLMEAVFCHCSSQSYYSRASLVCIAMLVTSGAISSLALFRFGFPRDYAANSTIAPGCILSFKVS